MQYFLDFLGGTSLWEQRPKSGTGRCPHLTTRSCPITHNHSMHLANPNGKRFGMKLMFLRQYNQKPNYMSSQKGTTSLPILGMPLSRKQCGRNFSGGYDPAYPQTCFSRNRHSSYSRNSSQCRWYQAIEIACQNCTRKYFFSLHLKFGFIFPFLLNCIIHSCTRTSTSLRCTLILALS